MLLGLDPLLSADALYVLRSMGHGDDLIIADANFPAESVSRDTVFGRPLRFDCDTTRAVRAVLSVMPVDTFVTDAVARMEVVGAPDEITEVQREVIDLLDGRDVAMVGIERFAFYERAKKAYAVLQTQERRFYGCFAIRKGVIGPEMALPG
ncbi:RbsD/FucU domain-containing protein [Aquamicrobium sp. LC103]|uniref:RbsD/FucU family protein n=1 Tax=Aquamicrobium sp. LC103 TaxID=1120658 RepID=UPI00063E8549|nr:RbsD/FucU domain-containing protein [Aquamicrobium sp. LC103]TKT74735.1 ribose ABC transporter [Aquamicrobium sp. LC103]